MVPGFRRDDRIEGSLDLSQCHSNLIQNLKHRQIAQHLENQHYSRNPYIWRRAKVAAEAQRSISDYACALIFK